MKIILFLLALVAITYAQTPIGTTATQKTDEQILAIYGNIDSLNTYFSDPSISFNGFINDTTIALAYFKRLNSVKGVPKVTVILQCDYGNGNWQTSDTLFKADSIETVIMGTKTISKIAPKYRVYIVGTAGNRRDTMLDLVLYSERRKH